MDISAVSPLANSNNTSAFMDTVIEQMSDTIVEKSGENITQQLYEQMKRNYNI